MTTEIRVLMRWTKTFCFLFGLKESKRKTVKNQNKQNSLE